MSNIINYSISIEQPTKHLLDVECHIENPEPNGQTVTMPAWIPGSYMIRDFAKNIINIEAFSEGKQITIEQLDKQTFKCAITSEAITIKYQIYCFDKSPRGCYIDTHKAFLQGARIFLQVHGKESDKHHVKVNTQQKVYCSMPDLTASNYWDFIDHPIVIGDFQISFFKIKGIPYHIVYLNKHFADLDTLLQDVKNICQGQIDYFADVPSFKKYFFFLNITENGYGGIEHLASSSILCSFDDLPVGKKTKRGKYKQLLGLFSHEYLHTWLVKRIKPKCFIEADLTRPIYTKQMWIFEGITSFLDNFNLVRTGTITTQEYLSMLQIDFKKLLLNPGRNKQTLEESSFTAWTKFYQQDENANNAIVSYYLKGSIVALCLDIELFYATKNKFRLQHILQHLWQNYGINRTGLEEGEFETIAEQVTGVKLNQFFNKYLRSTDEIDIADYLSKIGIKYSIGTAKPIDCFGVTLKDTNVVTKVRDNTIAEKLGITKNDQIIAINDFQMSQKNIDNILNSQQNESINVILARDGIIRQATTAEKYCSFNLEPELEVIDEEVLQSWVNKIKLQVS